MFDFDWPPSTFKATPVIQLAAGEQRKTTALAISSGVPKRPEGMFCLTNSAMPSGSCRTRRSHPPPGKRIEPGATELTRMPSGASCSALFLACEVIADLTALYIGGPPPSRPQIDVMLTTAPPPAARM